MPPGFSVASILKQDKFVNIPEDSNLIEAGKAFFAARVMSWIRDHTQEDENFNLPLYLTVLLYYRMEIIDLAFTENSEQILYKVISSVLGEKKHADSDKIPFKPIPQTGSIFDTEGIT